MAESLRFLGSLQGHSGWVTAIATSSETPDVILTASRGNEASFFFRILFRLTCLRQDYYRMATHPRRRFIRVSKTYPPWP